MAWNAVPINFRGLDTAKNEYLVTCYDTWPRTIPDYTWHKKKCEKMSNTAFLYRKIIIIAFVMRQF